MKDSTRAKPHIVYRCFNADGRLIYVGMTSLALAARMKVHEHKNLRVAADTSRVDVERHPDRASAARAESVAIDHERPLYNIRRGADYEIPFEELMAAASRIPGAS